MKCLYKPKQKGKLASFFSHRVSYKIDLRNSNTSTPDVLPSPSIALIQNLDEVHLAKQNSKQ